MGGLPLIVVVVAVAVAVGVIVVVAVAKRLLWLLLWKLWLWLWLSAEQEVTCDKRWNNFKFKVVRARPQQITWFVVDFLFEFFACHCQLIHNHNHHNHRSHRNNNDTIELRWSSRHSGEHGQRYCGCETWYHTSGNFPPFFLLFVVHSSTFFSFQVPPNTPRFTFEKSWSIASFIQLVVC